MSHESLVNRLRQAEILSYEPVTLRSGETSDFYADIKKAYGNPELLAAMAKATVDNLNPQTTCIAAAGYGGIPLGVAVSQISGLPLTLVRDSEKNHGRGGLIDGYVPQSHDIISIVDDVFTSGGSLRQTMANLKITNAVVVGCHVIVARGETADFGLPVSFILKSNDLGV